MYTCIVGSNRLWDAIDNGAIPVFTDPRQYGVLPFRTLWHSMTLLLHIHDHASTNDIAKVNLEP